MEGMGGWHREADEWEADEREADEREADERQSGYPLCTRAPVRTRFISLATDLPLPRPSPGSSP